MTTAKPVADPADPSFEFIKEELSRLAPPESAVRIRAAGSLEEVISCLGTVTVERWLNGTGAAEIRPRVNEPSPFGEAYSLAVRLLERGCSTRKWVWLDRAGVLIVYLCCGALLTVRASILEFLFHFHGPVLSSALGIPVFHAEGASLYAMGAVTGWFGFELLAAPRIMEGMRLLPMRMAARVRCPPCWRGDPLYGLWVLHVGVLFLMAAAWTVVNLYGVVMSPDCGWWQRLGAGACGPVLLCVLQGLRRHVHSTPSRLVRSS